jgi:hypothetical protein
LVDVECVCTGRRPGRAVPCGIDILQRLGLVNGFAPTPVTFVLYVNDPHCQQCGSFVYKSKGTDMAVQQYSTTAAVALSGSPRTACCRLGA